MKRQFLVIPLLLIVFCLSFSPKAFAAGQACCNTGWSTGLTGASLDPNRCCNASANLCTDTLCGAGEGCLNNICLAPTPTLPPCTIHQQCYDVPPTVTGCVGGGSIHYCQALGYPTIGYPSPTPDTSSRFCGNPPNEANGINTALGCIKIGSGNDLVNTILRLALGLGGGLALALILYGVFIVTTSAGMPDKLKAGSEIITSAIIGLIFILLSVFLVNLIGINILGIPGLL